MKRSSSKVCFGDVEVREYSRCLGDHPGNTGTGPPLSLGWEYKRRNRQQVTEFEAGRLRSNSLNGSSSSSFWLDGQQRRNILVWCAGETEEDIERAEKESQRIRKQRIFSKNTFGIEAIGRKVKSLAVQYISNHPYT